MNYEVARTFNYFASLIKSMVGGLSMHSVTFVVGVFLLLLLLLKNVNLFVWLNGLTKSFMNPAGVKRSNMEFQIKSQCSGILTFFNVLSLKENGGNVLHFEKDKSVIRKTALKVHLENIWLR